MNNSMSKLKYLLYTQILFVFCLAFLILTACRTNNVASNASKDKPILSKSDSLRLKRKEASENEFLMELKNENFEFQERDDSVKY